MCTLELAVQAGDVALLDAAVRSELDDLAGLVEDGLVGHVEGSLLGCKFVGYTMVPMTSVIRDPWSVPGNGWSQ